MGYGFMTFSGGPGIDSAVSIHEYKDNGFWQGQTVIRLSICSRATTPEDIDRTVAAFSKARGWHFPVAIGPEPC
jgi:hypothetical protein